MSINYSIEVKGNLLSVKAGGKDESVDDVKKYGEAVLHAAILSRCSRVLCDERELRYSISITETFEAAKFIADKAPRVGKVAIVCRKEQFDDAAFWETVAKNRGLRVCVTTDLKEAEQWLGIDNPA